MPIPHTSTSVSITNPLVLYRALLSTSRIEPDPAQHRLALHLQTLYNRLKDYEPIAQYGFRLQQLHRTLGSTPANPAPGTNHDAPRQNLFSSVFERRAGDSTPGSLALTKVLTSHESALQIDSPRGLLLHGEVGTGKSMLVDLFADCLPNRKKKRWHYNTFMLEVLAKLDHIRRSKELVVPTSLGQDQEYSLLWLARDLISTSPIIFLDEFQLPDRAAAKILTNLMTCFFQLGGVLVATSNRMPEELDKAAGVQFAKAPSRRGFKGLDWALGAKEPERKRSEFADFLELLRTRCEVWQMEGKRDYRRSNLAEESRSSGDAGHRESFSGLEPMSAGNVGLGWEQSTQSPAPTADDSSTSPAPSSSTASSFLPKFYYLSDDTSVERRAPDILGGSVPLPLSWTSKTLTVYGRPLIIPRAYQGVASFTFGELCAAEMGPTSAFGPADYITLASNFHTIVLTDVPVLSTLQKNEARRLITLLDALYEARCKLAVFATAGPDDLFFPETAKPKDETVGQDATYAETLSEIYQDATAPFRPNVSTYQDANPSVASPEQADATHARFAGLFDDDRADRQRNLLAQYETSSVDVGDARLLAQNQRDRSDTTANSIADVETGATAPSGQGRGPDFSIGAAYTGEDEKFAFRRAQSRLWELCSARWWAREHDPSAIQGVERDPVSQPSWWQPLSSDIRVWERPAQVPTAIKSNLDKQEYFFGEEGMGRASAISKHNDDVLFRFGRTSPFRTSPDPPPKLSWTHIWGMMKWGRKAGRWGQGPDAYKEGTDTVEETGDEYIQRRNEWRRRRSDGKLPSRRSETK